MKFCQIALEPVCYHAKLPKLLRSTLSTSAQRYNAPLKARSSHDTEETLEQRRAAVRAEVDRRKASYEDKYADRLKQKAKEAGVESVEELRRMRILADASAKANTSRAARPPHHSASSETSTSASKATKSAPAISSDSFSPAVPLSAILDVEGIRASDLDAESLGQQWIAYHASKTTYLSAAIPSNIFRRMLATAALYPEFVVPLARGADGSGVEMWLLQWSRPGQSVASVLFSPLAAYHARGVYAQPALVVNHYSDFLKSHGIALMRGGISDEGGKLLTAEEAKVLIWRLQRFYNTVPGETSTDGAKYRLLLEDFHKPRREGDTPFDVEKLSEIAHEV